MIWSCSLRLNKCPCARLSEQSSFLNTCTLNLYLTPFSSPPFSSRWCLLWKWQRLLLSRHFLPNWMSSLRWNVLLSLKCLSLLQRWSRKYFLRFLASFVAHLNSLCRLEDEIIEIIEPRLSFQSRARVDPELDIVGLRPYYGPMPILSYMASLAGPGICPII